MAIRTNLGDEKMFLREEFILVSYTVIVALKPNSKYFVGLDLYNITIVGSGEVQETLTV